MADWRETLLLDLYKRIERFQPEYSIHYQGEVIEAGDGIAWAKGLGEVCNQTIVRFSNDLTGMIFSLEKEKVGIIVFGEYSTIKQGMSVVSLDQKVSVPVGNALLGRVVNALGEPIDGKGKINFARAREIEARAPNVTARQRVNTPVQTGIKAIDALIPIGRGQREAIIGDRQTGKTTLVIDTILNQKQQNLLCIYVAIGQKNSHTIEWVKLLEENKAMDYTIVVVASPAESAVMQYIAPFTGCAMAEEFMEQGYDVLIAYDDLTKHAWAYRQISLLLRRPPGREAYPGDMFYVHARLLERSARLRDEPLGGGSITALPIVETQLSDIATYIPTNIISITDGQIFLDRALFNQGIRPAINIGLSVSRVGSDAQTNAIKEITKTLRLGMATYHEMLNLLNDAPEFSDTAKKNLHRGQRLQECLKQKPYKPLSLAEEVIVLYAYVNGYADSIPINRLVQWEEKLLRYFHLVNPYILREINQRKYLNKTIIAKLVEIIVDFNRIFL